MQEPAIYRMPEARSGISVNLNGSVGSYSIDLPIGWTLSGSIATKLIHMTDGQGHDKLGPFHEVAFEWNSSGAVRGTIRRYDKVAAVLFRLQYLESRKGNGLVFPNFSSIPVGLSGFSYEDRTFATPTFGLAQTSTPWLLFDQKRHSIILSPASSFMVAKMEGDGKSSMGLGLNNRLDGVPVGYEQDALLVAGDGIDATWDRWGVALKGLYRKKMPVPTSDILLEKYGYWTDNGADYYYNYDLSRGYARTLLDLSKAYSQEGIPLGYMQLDSWWYQKSIDDPSGKPGGKTKNSKLPEGTWNRYGGLMEYRAHPDLFPDGLSTFQRHLGMPLAVHNRWVDRKSPYHDSYRISGIGVVDPKWWKDTMEYISAAGVTCYEQDWLDPIYANSPEMYSTVGVADEFADGMANAARDRKLTIQYCMGTPRFFLQGVKYPNLTTIRTSGDRFEPGKWADFLFGSQFAQCVGIWPWCDVFKSSETGNLILSVLSCGPVGTGDAIGKEDKENIRRAVRADGVIVKPDRAMVPCDQTYLDGASHKASPFVASTYTDHAGLRTTYIFAFPRPKGVRTLDLSLRELGVEGPSYAYDFVAENCLVLPADGKLRMTIGPQGYAYFMVAPVTSQGIAIFGDLSKFVPTGKQRIDSLEGRHSGLYAKVLFAKGEQKVVIKGICKGAPRAIPIRGSVALESYDPVSGMFALGLSPARGGQSAEILIAKQ